MRPASSRRTPFRASRREPRPSGTSTLKTCTSRPRKQGPLVLDQSGKRGHNRSASRRALVVLKLPLPEARQLDRDLVPGRAFCSAAQISDSAVDKTTVPPAE
jgi:hypothetical protein